MPTPNTPRKKPAMNSPYATQTQQEQRIAARLDSPEKIRRALRLDNPHMWGVRRAKDDPAWANSSIPTPLYTTAGGSILNPDDFKDYR